MSWLVFALLAFVSYAISSSIDSYMMHHGYNRYSTAMLKMFFDGIFLLCLGLAFFHIQFSYTLIFWGALLGLLYAASNITYFLSLQKIAVDEVIPILQSSNIFFIFLGAIIFLHETPTLVSYGGLLFVLAGIYTLLSKDGLCVPKFHKAYYVLIISIIFHVISALLTKFGLKNIDSPISLAIVMYCFCTLFLLLYIVIRHTIDLPTVIYLKSHIKKIIIAAVFGALGTFLLYSALSLGDASLIYPLAGVQSVTLYFIMILFTKKKFSWHRLGSILCICLGIALLAL